MRIGIDIDGVLTDEHSFILDYGTKYFSEKKIKYKLHNDIYDSESIFEVTEFVIATSKASVTKLKSNQPNIDKHNTTDIISIIVEKSINDNFSNFFIYISYLSIT